MLHAILANANVKHNWPPDEEDNPVWTKRTLNRVAAEVRSVPEYTTTPLRNLTVVAEALGVRNVFLKDESRRFGGSFKTLGAAYGAHAVANELLRARLTGTDCFRLSAILSGQYSENLHGTTVACATDGNYGLAVAWCAKRIGWNAAIFVPQSISEGRHKAIKRCGAHIIMVDGVYDDALHECHRTATQERWRVLSDTGYESSGTTPSMVMQGYSVLATEIIGQLRALGLIPTHVFVQAGVGGLAASVIATFWRVFGPNRPVCVVTEPKSADCVFRSIAAGKLENVPGDLSTICAGLACGQVSTDAWPILRNGAHFVMSIDDELIGKTMYRLSKIVDTYGTVVIGETGVSGLAALLEAGSLSAARKQVGLKPDSVAVVIGTEGANDPALYADLIAQQEAVFNERSRAC